MVYSLGCPNPNDHTVAKSEGIRIAFTPYMKRPKVKKKANAYLETHLG